MDGKLKFGIVVLLFPLIVLIANAQSQPAPTDVYEPPGSSNMPFSGGYLLQLSIPEGVEKLNWGSNDFHLSFSVKRNKDGGVSEIERVVSDEDSGLAWQKPFEKACIEAIEKWLFKPTLNRKSEFVPIGTPIHIRFQKNKTGDVNIEIEDGGGLVLKTNTRFEK